MSLVVLFFLLFLPIVLLKRSVELRDGEVTRWFDVYRDKYTYFKFFCRKNNYVKFVVKIEEDDFRSLTLKFLFDADEGNKFPTLKRKDFVESVSPDSTPTVQFTVDMQEYDEVLHFSIIPICEKKICKNNNMKVKLQVSNFIPEEDEMEDEVVAVTTVSFWLLFWIFVAVLFCCLLAAASRSRILRIFQRNGRGKYGRYFNRDDDRRRVFIV